MKPMQIHRSHQRPELGGLGKGLPGRLASLTLVVAMATLLGCASKEFESGVLVETEPCANNTGPWNGLNDFKIRNDDGSLTVYKCHFKQAVSEDVACPGLGDPLCESNWAGINIGSSGAQVKQLLGEPIKVSGLRWQYPNNNSVSIENGAVVNIFQRSALLYTQPPL